MADLTIIQKLYLEALLNGPKESGELTRIVRDKLTELKGGNNPTGATGRSQAVLNELESMGYIKVVSKKFLGGKTYDITDKGRQALG